MSQLFTGRFWLAAAERALKTFAQALAALLVGDGTNIISIDWSQALAVSGTAALVSLLTSVASVGIGNPGPSLADESTELVLPQPGPDEITGPDLRSEDESHGHS